MRPGSDALMVAGPMLVASIALCRYSPRGLLAGSWKGERAAVGVLPPGVGR